MEGQSHEEAPIGAAPGLRETPLTRGISWVRRWSPYQRWLALILLFYVPLTTYLAYVRWTHLVYDTWDLSIFQQSLWTTTHGQILWESPDHELFGVASFFQVHPSLIMFPLAGVYALFPSALTLIFIEALATGLGAISLFFLARHITRSEGKAFLTAGLFLVWAPLLGANLYDFHLEAFLPAELFTFCYLWMTRRYVGGTMVAILASLTLEVAPIFAAFFLVFFYYDQEIRFLRWLGNSLGLVGPARNPSVVERAPLTGGPGLSVRWGVALGAILVGLYLMLRLLQGPFISWVLGYQPGYAPMWGLSTSSVGLGFFNLNYALSTKLTYWFTVLALLGFVPLLRPRTLILAIPWLIYTFFTAFLDYVNLGYSYGYIIAIPLFVGFAFGIDRLEMVHPRRLLTLAHRPALGSRAAERTTALLLFVVAANLLMGPLNPAVQYPYISVVGIPNPPTVSETYLPASTFQDLQRVASLITPGSTALVSVNLFSLTADHRNTYPMLWYPSPPARTPFNRTHLPDFVFLDRDQFAETPPYLTPFLYNSTVYGVRATVGNTTLGPVTLFEKAYHGPVESLDPLVFRQTYYYGPTLSPGYAAYMNDTNATFNITIQSTPPPPGFPLIYPPVWYGPYVSLPAGTYSISVSVRAYPSDRSPASPGTPALFLDAQGFATPYLFNETLSEGTLDVPGWATVTFSLTLPAMISDLEVRGYLLSPDLTAQLNYVEISPVGA